MKKTQVREPRQSKEVIAIVDDDLSVRKGVSSLSRPAAGNKSPDRTLGHPLLFTLTRALILYILGLRC